MRGHLEAGWCDDGWLTPPPPSLSLLHKITNPSLPRTKLSIPQPTRSFPSRPCFSCTLIKHVVSSRSTYTESRCTRISCILHVSIFLTDLTSSSLFLSLSLSLCFVRFVLLSRPHTYNLSRPICSIFASSLCTFHSHIGICSKCCFYNGWCRVIVGFVASYKVITMKCILIVIWLGLCEFEHVVKYYRPRIHLGIRQWL